MLVPQALILMQYLGGELFLDETEAIMAMVKGGWWWVLVTGDATDTIPNRGYHMTQLQVQPFHHSYLAVRKFLGLHAWADNCILRGDVPTPGGFVEHIVAHLQPSDWIVQGDCKGHQEDGDEVKEPPKLASMSSYCPSPTWLELFSSYLAQHRTVVVATPCSGIRDPWQQGRWGVWWRQGLQSLGFDWWWPYLHLHLGRWCLFSWQQVCLWPPEAICHGGSRLAICAALQQDAWWCRRVAFKKALKAQVDGQSAIATRKARPMPW